MGLQSSDFGLRPQDNFKVIRDFSINEQHLDILNRLFTPLIGPNAMGLYYYLDQFVIQDSEIVTTHYVIMSELKINLNEFRKQMDLLEAIGLVKSYVRHDSNDSSFVYKLIQPPSAYQFFSDPMLSIFLFSEVDKERYYQLKAYFEQNNRFNVENYQEITRKYTDVFKVPNKKLNDDVTSIKREKAYEGLNLAKVDFDFETLYDLLQSHFISTEIINADAKALITQLATLYGLTPEAMKSVILKSITSAQQLSFEDMRKYARTYYLMEHEQHLPSLQLKQHSAPKFDNNNKNSAEEDRLEQLNRVSPIEMLTSWKGSDISLDEKKLVEELVEREQLSFGVINILLQFVMLKEDMRLPKNYTLKIASHWKRKGLKTAQEAEPFAKKMNEEEQQQKSQRTYKQPRANLVSKEMTPKWLLERDDSINQSQKESNNQTMIDDTEHEKERAAFLEHLKERWGDDD
ncbi:replication initiation and membrane attachment family protein [Staphylococcus durrellii]|uniref:replication initiation and membrane attachment family protein n=1 Tax=Staphylococcus durrellii TaxID=2781773 RepID=UPI0018A04928|nr:DnaD domain protein [Staphylococcus durrellii]MBF7016888.1 DnaD domain protein [Staphylococcus durrellii]